MNFTYALVRSEIVNAFVVTFTQSDAAWVLCNCNEGNRVIDRGTVSSYISQMEKGLWKLNGETIIFSKRGMLKNGFHRLTAVAESGVPLTTIVVVGVEDDVFATIDSGKNRTLRDNISIVQLNDDIVAKERKSISNMTAKLIKVCLAIENGTPTEHGSSSTRRVPNNDECLQFYHENKDKIFEILPYVKTWESSATMKGGAFKHKNYFGGIALWLFIHKTPLNMIDGFMTTLLGGNYASHNATEKLRDYMTSHTTTRFKPTDVWNIYAMSWNAYLSNEPLRIDKRVYTNSPIALNLVEM